MGFEAGDVNFNRKTSNSGGADPTGLFFQEEQPPGVWEQLAPSSMIPRVGVPPGVPRFPAGAPLHPCGVLNPMTEEQVKHWEREEKGREILESGRQLAHLEYAFHAGARGLFYFGRGGILETSVFIGEGRMIRQFNSSWIGARSRFLNRCLFGINWLQKEIGRSNAPSRFGVWEMLPSFA